MFGVREFDRAGVIGGFTPVLSVLQINRFV